MSIKDKGEEQKESWRVADTEEGSAARVGENQTFRMLCQVLPVGGEKERQRLLRQQQQASVVGIYFISSYLRFSLRV